MITVWCCDIKIFLLEKKVTVFVKIMALAVFLLLFCSSTFSFNQKSSRTSKRTDQVFTLKKTKCSDTYFRKRYKKAMAICKKLAKNNSEAQYLVARMYYNGEGVRENYVMARKWYLIAARNNNVNAQKMLASMFWVGVGVKRNTKRAFFWFSRLANQGNKYGEYMLGVYYTQLAAREKKPKFYKKMLYWLKRSAGQNYAPALYLLSTSYYNGVGTKIDDVSAFKYMKRSANAGFWQAFYPLAKMYEYGHGVRIDLRKAMFWYGLSAETPHRQAAKHKLMLLSSDQ